MSHPNNSTGLQLFSFEGQEVRAVWINDEAWYVLTDVCKILGLGNPAQVATRLKKEGCITRNDITDALGRPRETLCVNLPNYLRAIMRSDKSDALRFQDWVCEEVVPTILKTGSYSVGNDLLADLKKWQLSTKVVDAIVKAVRSKQVIGDKERAGYAAVLLQTLRRQLYHDTRSYEGALETLYGKGSIPNIKGDIVKMTAEINNGQVIIQLQFPFDNALESA